MNNGQNFYLKLLFKVTIVTSYLRCRFTKAEAIRVREKDTNIGYIFHSHLMLTCFCFLYFKSGANWVQFGLFAIKHFLRHD